MGEPELRLAVESPLAEDLGLLMQRHALEMAFDTPPESNHALGAELLADPQICFLVMRLGGVPVAMGAYKRMGAGRAEIKSMHVLTEYRGQGLSGRLLEGLVAQAQGEGITALLLETGTQAMFAPARALYKARGFVECGPFGDYQLDPYSVFMRRDL